jgi:23S rRNA (cytosine1962-C5)-methyltransferase
MMPGMAGTLAGLDHALLDVGEGRRLERFGSIVVDRPWPPVEGSPRADRAAWRAADARFDRITDGPVVHAGWTTRDGRPIKPWTVVEDGLRCELRLAPSGQVGLFPEQAANRAWLRRAVEVLVGRAQPAQPAGPAEPVDRAELPGVLNLFAYTGVGTLAAVSGGARATHVDAARAAVAWARRNADLNGLGDRPIRWIADDASTFVRREARRGRRYAGIVLDPPSYGHGPGGRDWRLERDLPGLIAGCAQLLEEQDPAFVVLTAHTPGVDGDRLAGWLKEAIGRTGRGRIEVAEMVLHAVSGTRLPLGWSARWTT